MFNILFRTFLVLLAYNSVAQNFVLENVLKNQKDPVFQKVLSNPAKYRVQVLYSRPISRTSFLEFNYRSDFAEYFYPASLAKLPLSVLAYDKINKLGIQGLNTDAQLITYGVHTPLAKFKTEDSTYKHLSIKDHVTRCFVVSDNQSPNYLYEFLGHEYINTRLQECGFDKLKLNQRFAHADKLSNKITGKVALCNQLGDTLMVQEACTSKFERDLNIDHLVGLKHYNSNGKLMNKPYNFNLDNDLSLAQLHEMWKQVCYPFYPSSLALTTENKIELKKTASILPDQSAYPNYYHFADNYRKFLCYGDTACKIPSNVIIASKVGLAYGFISEVAYYKDCITGIEFSLSTALYVNENEIINDGKYQYETIGLPFMGKLGRLIIDYEWFLLQYRNKSTYNIAKNIKYTFGPTAKKGNRKG